MTRRTWRKNRPSLTAGDTQIEGVVKKFFPLRGYGFIQPANKAARIHFHMINVAFSRQKCVKEGRTVYFSVAMTKSGTLTAHIT